MAPYLSTILTFVASLLTLGITWGMLRTTVDHVKAEVTRLRDTSDAHTEILSSLREEMRVNYAELTSGREAGKMSASRPARKRRRK